MKKVLAAALAAAVVFFGASAQAGWGSNDSWGNGGRDEGLRRDLGGVASLVVALGVVYLGAKTVPRIFEKKNPGQEMLENYEAVLEIEKRRMEFQKKYGREAPANPFFPPTEPLSANPASFRYSSAPIPRGWSEVEQAVVERRRAPDTDATITLEVGGKRKKFRLTPID